TVFFTFEGLNLIHKQGVKGIVMPNGNEQLEEGFKNANVLSVEELASMAQEMDVKFIACQMTMDVMGINNEDLFDNIEVGGAVTFLEFAKDADIALSF
ncbi:MAG: DsrE/DsrF/DrsH-like family protein, partial [Clostridium sp.]